MMWSHDDSTLVAIADEPSIAMLVGARQDHESRRAGGARGVQEPHLVSDA